MAFRAATARIAVPAATKRLMKILEGQPAVQLEPRGLMASFKRQLTLYYLHRHAGFASGYFYGDGDFLDGAGYALSHAAETLPGSMSIMDKALQQVWKEGVRETEDAGLRLTWKVEEVTSASLGNVRLVFGLRRREFPIPTPAFRHEVAGHCIVLPGERRHVASSDLVDMLRKGVTLSAEALLTCRQSVTLWKPSEDSDDEPIAHSFDEEAAHCLRLEAELLADESKSDGVAVNFDEAHGWIVSDMNGTLDGNCVAKTVPVD